MDHLGHRLEPLPGAATPDPNKPTTSHSSYYSQVFSCVAEFIDSFSENAGKPGAARTAKVSPPPALSVAAPYMFRLNSLVIGDSGVGKTSLVNRFTEGAIPPAHNPTIGVEFSSKLIRLLPDCGTDTKVKLNIWDTSGHRSFRSLTCSYYTNAALVLLVFDVGRRASFDSLQNWLARTRGLIPAGACLLLVGNKSDRPVGSRGVSKKEAEAFARRQDVPYFETSAKSGLGVAEVFAHGAAYIWKEVAEHRLQPTCATGIKMLR